jgi:hypothetical protein
MIFLKKPHISFYFSHDDRSILDIEVQQEISMLSGIFFIFVRAVFCITLHIKIIHAIVFAMVAIKLSVNSEKKPASLFGLDLILYVSNSIDVCIHTIEDTIAYSVNFLYEFTIK